MEYLAISIFISTVLYLVDKNHAWPTFWRVGKWAAATLLLLGMVGIGYYEYQQHASQKAFNPNAPYEAAK